MNQIRSIHARVLALAVVLAGGLISLAVPSATAAGTCVSTPMVNPTTSATYTATVCLTQPTDGGILTGNVDVTGTITFTGTSPGVQRMVYSLNGNYLLTDYSTPYTFSLHTTRWVDGAYQLSVHALLRDTNVTPDTTINLTFNNGITTPPVNTNTFTPPAGNPYVAGTTYTLAAAGDGAGGEASETAVTNLMQTMNPNLALYLGDVYEKGTSTEFDNWYGLNQPTNTFYGRFRDITLPTIGNHEYTAGVAAGYFDYWDNIPHYYSVNRHGWHLISLDANSAYNQTAPGTAQYQWLQNDLATNTQPCTLAFWHQPLFNIGDEGPSTNVQPLWALLANAGADLVINGHDHTYQRYAALDANGNPSPTGMTEIINGAGGHALGGFPSTDPNLVASAQQFGVLKLGLNSAGASYQFVGTNGTVIDNGSVKCDPTRNDSVSPTAATNLAASSVYKTRIDLNWTEGTDNVGVTSYKIYRDNGATPLATIPAGNSYSDTTVTPGSTHSYQVRAVDAAGNQSALSNLASATTPTVSVLFHDGFETGDMSRWQNPGGTTNPPNAGMTVQSAQVFDGQYAARSYVASPGSVAGSSAWKTLASPQSNLYTIARFYVTSHTSTVNLFRLRAGTASSSPIATIGLSTTNRLTLRNDGGATPATTSSSSSLTTGAWHTVQLHTLVNGANSLTEVWLDGVQVPELSFPTTDLGANQIAKLELGDPGSATTAKAFDVFFDEVAYDTDMIGDLAAPTNPTGLTASAHSGVAVDLAWNAATDDVGVAGYDIYRNGALLTSAGAATTYRDNTVTPGNSYTYQVLARDGAGNQSGLSNAATVQTGDIFSDGFESGTLGAWTSSSGLVTQQNLVDTGAWAARATSDGTAGASAQVTLDTPQNDLYYRLRFDPVSQGANQVTLARVRTAANASMVTAYITSAGKLAYRNDQSGISTVTGTTVTPGQWHELQLHVTVGSPGNVDLWLDGVLVASNAEDVGTAPIGRLELGDPSTARVFDVAFDGVLASPSFVVDTAPPTPPVNLQVTGNTAAEVDLSWQPATDDVGVTAYRIIRDGVVLGDVDNATTTYADTTIQPNTTYTYRVYALDAVGHRSDSSNMVSVDTVDTLPPSAPTNLAGQAKAGTGEIDLTWTGSTDNRGVTAYRVYRGGTFLANVGLATSYADTGLASQTPYTYTVTAVDAAGNESTASSPATVTSADLTPPSKPGTPTVTAVSDSALTVAWTAATDASGIASYSVYRDGGGTPVFTGNALTFTDSTGLNPDTTHSYTVTATDTAGNVGLASAPGSGTTAVFGDGFESGNLSKWTSGNLVVAKGTVAAGLWAAHAVSAKNTASFASKTLPNTYTDLTATASVYLNGGKQDGADLIQFQTSTGAKLLTLGYASNKKLQYTNNVANKIVGSNLSVAVGVWTTMKVRLQVSGATGAVTVWVNGTQVPQLSGTVNVGTTPINRLVIGNSGTGLQYDYYLDEVRASRTP